MNRKTQGLGSLHSGIQAGLKAYAGGGPVQHFTIGGTTGAKNANDYSPSGLDFLDYIYDNFGAATTGGAQEIFVDATRIPSGGMFGGFDSAAGTGNSFGGGYYGTDGGGISPTVLDAIQGSAEGSWVEPAADEGEWIDDGYGGSWVPAPPKWVPKATTDKATTDKAAADQAADAKWVPPEPSIQTTIDPGTIKPPNTPFANIDPSMLGSLRDVTSNVYVPNPNAYINTMNANYDTGQSAPTTANPYGDNSSVLGRLWDFAKNAGYESIEGLNNVLRIASPELADKVERAFQPSANTTNASDVDSYLSSGYNMTSSEAGLTPMSDADLTRIFGTFADTGTQAGRAAIDAQNQQVSGQAFNNVAGQYGLDTIDPFANSGVYDYGGNQNYGYDGASNADLNALAMGDSFANSGVDSYGGNQNYGYDGASNADLNALAMGDGTSPDIDNIIVTATNPNTNTMGAEVTTPVTSILDQYPAGPTSYDPGSDPEPEPKPKPIEDIPNIIIPGKPDTTDYNTTAGTAATGFRGYTGKKDWTPKEASPQLGTYRSSPLVQTGTDSSSGMNVQTYAPGALQDYLARLKKLQTSPQAEGSGGVEYQTLPGEGMASGGMASLPEYRAGGKLLRGPGDGMSDSIPAMIHGKEPQQAALADGEFVVPADVVSHLGNGSTEAGAKLLYAMMDRIRHARTGRKRQAPAVEASKFLPA